mmetsp:Transcript_1997/g.4213  ORF Transcript_1997/g.4213 Transcript_1997/m.4213 type:complete len:90 (+) Transcript_1997:58-327(+)
MGVRCMHGKPNHRSSVYDHNRMLISEGETEFTQMRDIIRVPSLSNGRNEGREEERNFKEVFLHWRKTSTGRKEKETQTKKQTSRARRKE